ncbi:MAG: asparagine synthase C-terminal domain-containing protein [Candidatus Omnitrophica bacterium]|nr:asparagine synthase C-terminal domain-containing protein [Candidatus Omnitrophota bacterium]
MFIFSLGKEIKLTDDSHEKEKISLGTAEVTLFFDKNKYSFDDQKEKTLLQEKLIGQNAQDLNFFFTILFDKKKSQISVSCGTSFFKPVYYIENADAFFCSSHISLFQAIGLSLEENTDVLPEYFLYRCVSPPNTLFESVKLLNFGEALIVNMNHGKYSVEIQQSLNTSISKDKDESEHIDSILRALKDYLKLFENNKNKIATLCSGGMDSLLLAKLVQKTLGSNKTYSTDYPVDFGGGMRERKYALFAAQELKTDHTFYEFGIHEYFHGLIDSISAAEMPVHHLQSVCMYNLFKKGILPEQRILLSGLGGDDIFGARNHETVFRIGQYYPYYCFLPFKAFFKKLSYSLFKKCHRGYNLVRYFKHCEVSYADEESFLWSISAYGKIDWIKKVFRVSKKEIFKSRMNLLSLFPTTDMLTAITYYYLFTSLVMTLSIWHRLAENCNITLCSPLNNLRIIESSLKIPWKSKLQTQKYIIRTMCENVGVSPALLNREKSSFGFDVRKWGGQSGFLMELISAFTVKEKKDQFKIDLFDTKGMEDAMTLWSLLNYYIWYRIFILRQPIEELHLLMKECLKDWSSV